MIRHFTFVTVFTAAAESQVTRARGPAEEPDVNRLNEMKASRG